jgi:hypothetical protein
MIFYIDTVKGYDENHGLDERNPFLTWLKAFNVMSEGDTLRHVFEHNYDEVDEKAVIERGGRRRPNVYFLDADHGIDGGGFGTEGTDVMPFKTFGYAKGFMKPGDTLADITQRQVYTFEAVQARTATLKPGGAMMEASRIEKFQIRGVFTAKEIQDNIHKKQDLVVVETNQIAKELWEVTVLRQLCDMPDTFKAQSGS